MINPNNISTFICYIYNSIDWWVDIVHNCRICCRQNKLMWFLLRATHSTQPLSPHIIVLCSIPISMLIELYISFTHISVIGAVIFVSDAQQSQCGHATRATRLVYTHHTQPKLYTPLTHIMVSIVQKPTCFTQRYNYVSPIDIEQDIYSYIVGWFRHSTNSFDWAPRSNTDCIVWDASRQVELYFVKICVFSGLLRKRFYFGIY